MGNPVITNIDNGSPILDNATCVDRILVFAGAATYAKGTVLARQRVATAVVAAVGANTGNGTVTGVSVVGGLEVPIAGIYVFRCRAAVANGGVFALLDPNGGLVSGGISLTVGAGATTIVEAGGLEFTVTDGATDFAIGDSFILTVAAVDKLIPYSATGVGGAQVATDVLTYEVTKTGAGDLPIRSMVRGRVRRERLVIHPATTVTALVVEQLRNSGITAVEVQELGAYDNQL